MELLKFYFWLQSFKAVGLEVKANPKITFLT